MDFSMEGLFGATTIAEFKSSFLDQKPLHVQGDPGRFSGLFSWADLDALLRYHGRGATLVLMSHDGRPIPNDAFYHDDANGRRYNSGGGDNKRIDVRRFCELLRGGATLHVTPLSEVCEPVIEFAERLEGIFLEDIEVAAFAAWGGSHGLPLHYSDDGVIVLQVAGRKKWTVYEPTLRRPVRQLPTDYQVMIQNADRGDFANEEAARELERVQSRPAWTGVLTEGDLLYIPRGWFHKVHPLNEPTLHLACVFAPLTGVDLMEYLTEKLRDHELFREMLPRFRTDEEKKHHMEKLHRRLSEVWRNDLLGSFFGACDETRTPLPRFNLQSRMAAGALLSEQDRLIRWVPVRPVRTYVDEGAGVMTIRALGQTVTCQGDVRAAEQLVQYLASRKSCPVREVLGSLEGAGVTPSSVQGFLESLVASGLATVDA